MQFAPEASGHVLECRGLSKTYTNGKTAARRGPVKALDNVSLRLGYAETVAIVGRSGSGKSTLARCLVQMECPDSGKIFLEGKNVRETPKAFRSGRRRMVQLILQNTAAAMNPRFSVLEIIEEPLLLRGGLNRSERREHSLAMMRQVGLDPQLNRARPSEVSGGQRQKIAIARALMVTPKVLILDEALSGIDLRSRIQILDVLTGLQQSFGLSYLFITHDMGMTGSLNARVSVMSDGKVCQSFEQ